MRSGYASFTSPRTTASGRLGLAMALIALASFANAVYAGSETYQGTCDASAAVALGNGLFVVANDEDNRLRVYLADHPGEPLAVDEQLYKHFGIEPDAKKSEADIEGATWLDDQIYWISSHGRDGEGKQRPNRLQFFATKVVVTEKGIAFNPVGRAYTELLDDLLADKDLDDLNLADAVQPEKKTVPELAPKEKGVNIEGLAATPGGDLLIGFRNPRPQGRALVVRLKNPKAVIEDGARAKFGKPVLLDLDGLGVRSMEYDPQRKTYWIVAGSHTEEGPFALYRWSGQAEAAPVRLAATGDLRPEALIVYPGREGIQLLSDDGGLIVQDAQHCTKPKPDGSCECKDLTPEAQRFRSTWVTPQQ